ncbi:MAG: FAD-dependent oxidoreductase [Lachnospiraceae bacterium]
MSSTTKFKNLFSPVTICGHVYRNRIINAPTLFAHSVLFIPEIRENVYRMVENRAKGGAAAVSTGEISVNAEEARCLFLDRGVDFTKYSGDDFEAFKEYADRIKTHGAISYLEFCHEGAHAEALPPYQPWGPDSYTRKDGIEVKGMNPEMMEKVILDFVNISLFAKASGFDGILIHGGHGFLFQQFLSPWTNHRTDEFGGSLENRARFPKQILNRVRKAVGKDMIIEFRISAEDGVPGGLMIEETSEFCSMIDGIVDIIHISNGLKWAGNKTNTFSDFFDIHGVNVEHARKVKEKVTASKVSVIGGINSPEMAEEILSNGYADFVELGRQGFADPEFPNKAANGQEADIRRCVRCFQCYPGFCEHETDLPLWEKGLSPEEVAKIYSPASMGRCAINPNSGFGYYPETMPKFESTKKVLVVGGGVSGLQAALTSSERGHTVILAEKCDRIGGTLNFTDTDTDKVDLRNFKNLLIRKVTEDPNIHVLLNTTVDDDFLRKNPSTYVVIAVGSRPIVPPIDGIEHARNGLWVYDNMDQIGTNVLIAGGGLVGCEIALHLAAENRTVTVIEKENMMAKETFGYYRNALLVEMEQRNIHQLLNTTCLSFTPEGILVETNGSRHFLSADTVIYSMGMQPNSGEAAELKKACEGRICFVTGDCSQAGKVGDAVRAGYMAAMHMI